jgi:hypothetical protein
MLKAQARSTNFLLLFLIISVPGSKLSRPLQFVAFSCVTSEFITLHYVMRTRINQDITNISASKSKEDLQGDVSMSVSYYLLL